MIELHERRKCVILDIDGTLVIHSGTLENMINNPPVPCPGVLDKMLQWHLEGHCIILITGRPESFRKFTEQTLSKLGIPWDHLIMGVGSGQRMLVNDLKPGCGMPTAISISIDRDSGLEQVDF